MIKSIDEQRIDFEHRCKVYDAFSRWYKEGKMNDVGELPGVSVLCELFGYSNHEYFKANMNDRDRRLCTQLGGEHGWTIYMAMRARAKDT